MALSGQAACLLLYPAGIWSNLRRAAHTKLRSKRLHPEYLAHRDLRPVDEAAGEVIKYARKHPCPDASVPPWIVVIKGRLIFTIVWDESVFSPPLRLRAPGERRPVFRQIDFFFFAVLLHDIIRQHSSKSSPPR